MIQHNKNDISSMARAGFIDHRRAKVEAKNGDACIIGFNIVFIVAYPTV